MNPFNIQAAFVDLHTPAGLELRVVRGHQDYVEELVPPFPDAPVWMPRPYDEISTYPPLFRVWDGAVAMAIRAAMEPHATAPHARVKALEEALEIERSRVDRVLGRLLIGDGT